MPSKRQRRRIDDPTVPNIADNAEERKRVLNVLAQRRYRRRKREHLAALEARVQNSGHEGQGPAVSNPTLIEKTVEIPSELDILPEIYAENSPPASPGTLKRAEATFVDALNSIDYSNSQSDFLNQSEIPGLAPRLDLDSPASQSSSSALTLPTPSSFDSLFPLTPPSPQLEAFSYQFLQTPFNEENFTPNDLSATLQSHQTTTFTFPDDHIIEIPTLTLLRAILTVADRLHLKDRIWAMDAMSPFYTGPEGLRSPNPSSSSSSTGSSFLTETLPAHLQPTPTQRLIPHHPILDLFPWPATRDKLIQVFSLPEEFRPASASHPMALMNLVYDTEDPSEGMRVSGADPFKLDMWEVGQVVFERWWWAFETRVVETSNRLRRRRGQQGLIMGQTAARG
ncbi:hypothetical protein AJ79_01508 [Helicocarpus griseus UAMH5409]|uniref:BZIP domain-containing protein n=1 Tax=Helicocarpus griseus UAMH5409 TaxID=1447875 RepID=A0A2B7XYI9_9EURO|nr:hypothetical protein AJ79_01508 [Helicocarpus griseus UAMH5409]